MKSKIIVGLLCLALVPFGVAFADEEDHAESEVFVDVLPNIAIASVAPVDLGGTAGGVQTGDFGEPIRFRVDANTQTVKFMVCVTRLYKGDDCTSTAVLPIEINVPEGVIMEAEAASPTGGVTSPVSYDVAHTFDATCFTGWKTDWVEFESSQNNHFSQYLDVEPTWVQDDNEKPMGEYSGFVSLWAHVVL